MPSRSPLIHVGYQKTASTFLQQEIFNDTERFFTPWGARASLAIEHFVLRHPCRFDPTAIRAEILSGDGRLPVVSHEDLLGYPVLGRYYPEQVLGRIAQTFPDARVLICLREQRSMVLSNYFQYIRQGGTLSLSEVLNGNAGRAGFRPLFRLEHFEYDLTHAVLRKFFDDSQILMLPFEILKKDQSRFLGILGDFAGIKLPAQSSRPVVNRRRSATALRAEQYLNRKLPNPPVLPEAYGDYPIRVRARNRLVRYIDVLSDRTTLDASYLRDLVEQIDENVGDYFASSNEATSRLTGFDLFDLGYRTVATRPEWAAQ